MKKGKKKVWWAVVEDNRIIIVFSSKYDANVEKDRFYSLDAKVKPCNISLIKMTKNKK